MPRIRDPIVSTAVGGSSAVLDLQDGTGATKSKFDANAYGFIDKATWQLAVGAPATVGVNKTGIYIVPRAGIIVKAFAACKTAPTGAALIFDIKKGGTTIWSTTANRLSIAAAATSGSQTTFNVTTVAEGDQLTIDIAQIGSTIAGQDITIVLLMLLRNQP